MHIVFGFGSNGLFIKKKKHLHRAPITDSPSSGVKSASFRFLTVQTCRSGKCFQIVAPSPSCLASCQVRTLLSCCTHIQTPNTCTILCVLLIPNFLSLESQEMRSAGCVLIGDCRPLWSRHTGCFSYQHSVWLSFTLSFIPRQSL